MGVPRTQHRAGNGRQPPESSLCSSWQPFGKPSRKTFALMLCVAWTISLLAKLDKHFAIRSSFSFSLLLLLREDLWKNCHSESSAQSSLPSSWQKHEHHRHNYYVSRKLTITHTNVFDLLGHRPMRQRELLDLDIQHNPITCAYFFLHGL